jgi:nitrate reductase delta subunit
MPEITTIYDSLAGLISYPAEGYLDRLAAAAQMLAADMPEAAGRLDCAHESLRDLSPEQLEELYTQTFDMNPACSLEVGWHLYGENYSRGEFLVQMRQDLRRFGLSESTELPDHLTHVLRAVARMTPARADRCISGQVLPALQKMLAGLGENGSPYQHVLEAIRSVLTSPYGAVLEGAQS